jgi:hypothetical protein
VSDIFSTNTRGWAVPTQLQPDELFSSWLVRSALANGCDSLAFTDAIWPKWRVWTIDIDREIPQERLELLAKSSGIPAHSLDASTLWSVASLICNRPLPKKNFWSWILTLGARNRLRSGGLQYCPVCLAEDKSPYFRKYWRYAWHTACEKHGTILLDRCNVCRSAIQPHRLIAEAKTITICPVCGFDLRHGQAHVVAENTLSFQEKTDRVLLGQKLQLHNVDVTAAEWFTIARLYWDLVRRIMDGRTESLNSLGRSIGLHHLNIRPGTLSIEQARTKDRHAMLCGVYLIMNLSDAQIMTQLNAAAVTFQAFCPSRVLLPRALKEIANQLKSAPVTRKRKPKVGRIDVNRPKSRKMVERMMQRLIDRTVL